MVNGAVFSSISSMEKLLDTQQSVITHMNSYLDKVSNSIKPTIQKYIVNCVKEQTKAQQNVGRYLENPINDYRLIKRLYKDLDYVEKILKLNLNYSRKINLTYPTEVDFEHAKRIINKLISIYSLNVDDFANGIVQGYFSKSGKRFVDIVSPMTSSDCYEMALSSYKDQDYYMCILWTVEAVNRHEQDCDDCPHTKADLIQLINRANKYLSNENKKNSWQELVSSANNNRKNTQFLSLQCEYRSGPDPFLRLARFKVEVLHRNPEITMLHDVISNYEIETLQHLATTNVRSRYQFSEAEVDGGENYVRICHATWLSDKITEVAKISRRALDMIGYKALLPEGIYRNVSAEMLHVIYYGPGGFYLPHLDVNKADFSACEQGIRRHTVLFYLSTVNLGGATIFPTINVTVYPVKNSAILWDNLLAGSSEVDENTLHAGCPVLHGSKRIAVKWISERFKPICPLEQPSSRYHNFLSKLGNHTAQTIIQDRCTL